MKFPQRTGIKVDRRPTRRPFIFAVALLLAFVLSGLGLTNASATGTTKIGCATPDLIGAIANPTVSSIKLDAFCTYSLTASLPPVNRLLTIEGDYSNIKRTSATPFGIFTVLSTGNLTLKNLTVSNGLATGNGGGLVNIQGTVTLINTTFYGNMATNGGGLVNVKGKVAISRSRFLNNEATAGDNSTSLGLGGGLFSAGGTITVEDSYFAHNKAITGNNSTTSGSGGGIYVTGGTLISVKNSSFSFNEAVTGLDSFQSSFGGGIASFLSLLTVADSNFSFNQVLAKGNTIPPVLPPGNPDQNKNGQTAFGGGLFSFVPPSDPPLPFPTGTTINNSKFSHNKANCASNCFESGGGGGLFNFFGTLTIKASTISYNSAFAGAGSRESGIGGGAGNSFGSFTLDSDTLNNNTAESINSYGSGLGGGFVNTEGGLNAINDTFASNSATTHGGTVSGLGGGVLNLLLFGGSGNILNSTFSKNSAEQSGDGLLTGKGGNVYALAGKLTLTNSLLANGNKGGNCGFPVPVTPPYFGTIVDGGHNLDSANTCGFTAIGSLVNTNPRLDDDGLDWNGGPTRTIGLKKGSAAIDAADATKCPLTDQRGFDRSNICDIGSYEYLGIPPA